MIENNALTQTNLIERWQVAESTLERWRNRASAQMIGRVSYPLSDITDFEQVFLRGSTARRASARSDPQDTREALLAPADT